MKVMSIIGVCWFSFSLVCIFAFSDSDQNAAIGWGVLGMLYAIPYSITGIIKSVKPKKSQDELTRELLNLNELKEKGIITDNEFEVKKTVILNM
jgi:hypothetical protein